MNQELKKIIEDIYSSYNEKLFDTQNLLDQEHRDPSNIINLVKELNLIPPKEKTVRAVGSKGKGITLNILKAFFKKYKKKKKIATFSSPYKFHHLDQLQIDGLRITDEKFIYYYNKILPKLEKVKENLDVNEYLSPFGIFLIIGLYWFKDENVDYYLLETGRGVKYDEVGNIPSEYALFISLTNEHLNHIGPTIVDVFLNKIEILKTSNKVLIHEDLKEIFEKNENYLGKEDLKKIIWVKTEDTLENIPNWYKKDYSIAKKMFSFWYPYQFIFRRLNKVDTVNFGKFIYGEKTLYFDSGSSLDSLDKDFFDFIQKSCNNLIVIASFDDRKDVWGLSKFFYDNKLPLYHVILRNKYLKYEKTKEFFETEILDSFSEDNLENFENFVNKFSSDPICIYFIGSNKFIRFVKKLKKD